MSSAFRLSLAIGPGFPVPVPQDVLEAVTTVEVTHTSTGPNVFQVSFDLETGSPLHTLFLLSGGASIPLVRVQVVVTVNGTPEVLMDGVMTNHQVTAGGEGGHARLSITGEDLSKVMDYIDFSGTPYPAMPPEARVLLILAKYAVFGIVPMVIPSVLIDVPIPIDKIPVQQGKDLAYVRRLAEDVGYVFYVEPGPEPGISTAYWGPELKVGVPQPALNVDIDLFRNVESFSPTFNGEGKTLPVLLIQEPNTKAPIPIPIPDITPLNPPLGLVPPLPKQIEWLSGPAKYGPVRAALLGLAKAAKTADVVTASGSLDVLRYGRPLKARRLVGVRGAGPAFDGLYYVKSVTSTIKRGAFNQSFTLTRNGLLSTVPTVPV